MATEFVPPLHGPAGLSLMVHLETATLDDPIPVGMALVERALTGDEAAFEQIYRSLNQSVYRVGRAITGNEESARDVVQDTPAQSTQARSDRSRLASVLRELESEPPPLLSADEAEQLRLSILGRARRNEKRQAILGPIAASLGALAALLVLVVAGRLVAPPDPTEPAPMTAKAREVHLVLRTAETEVRFRLSVPSEAPGKSGSAR